MKKAIILVFAFFLINNAQSQTYVTIPDSEFATWLIWNVPNAMNGNQLDITHPDVTTLTNMDLSNMNIVDLSGVQYFTSLRFLKCGSYSLTNIPALPNKIRYFGCSNNQLTSLPPLPDSLLNFDCSWNQLTSLPALPGSLVYFNCFHNQITSLPALPDSIQKIYCDSNQLTTLPTLPLKLNELHCAYNQITSFPSLPNNISDLFCQYNKLTSLPSLPNNLYLFDCSFNMLAGLPALPINLYNIDCSNNLLTSLPNLPTTAYFKGLICNNNHLSELPTLPSTVTYLVCNDNQLTTLPDLPAGLSSLNCSNNLITCLPPIPNAFYWYEFNLSGNLFTCLPNYVNGMSNALLNMPLCINGDTTNNHYNCSGFEGVAGNIYKDNNTNCSLDNGEPHLENIHLSIFDSTNNLVGQTYSFSSGAYIFSATAGTYTVRIDTAGMPYKINCANTNIDSTVILTNANSSVINVNYPVNCKPGFDLGVQSVVSNGLVFPGQFHKLLIKAGDMSQWNNLDCSTGVSGQVQVTVTGPVTFHGVVPGALVPTVAGNTFTYNIPDFGSINNSTAFGLQYSTDTTAQAGDNVCVDVIVTPLTGDNNPANNIYNFCYSVFNSFDPNMKETYPAKALPGYSDYFTYTVHFQNTGTASAINIRIVDTLSSNLDLSTFQVINYSHVNSVSLAGNILTVRYPNILLPDSGSNHDASLGFIQYRIKPKANMIDGTQIKNTAWIYFDYNAPIATNTTINLFDLSGVNELVNSESTLAIYPNPTTSSTNIEYNLNQPSKVNLSVYNFMGALVTTICNEQQSAGNYKKTFNAKKLGLKAGIYFVRLSVNGKSEVKKLVVVE